MPALFIRSQAAGILFVMFTSGCNILREKLHIFFADRKKGQKSVEGKREKTFENPALYFTERFLSGFEILTYPSGCNLMRKRFRLKLSFRIFAQENVLILEKFWKTTTPRWATDRLRGTPSWSWKTGRKCVKLRSCPVSRFDNSRLVPSRRAF